MHPHRWRAQAASAREPAPVQARGPAKGSTPGTAVPNRTLARLLEGDHQAGGIAAPAPGPAVPNRTLARLLEGDRRAAVDGAPSTGAAGVQGAGADLAARIQDRIGGGS